MLKIVQAPDPVLFQNAKPVKSIDKVLSRLIKNMEETLINSKDPEGVGLAAPQVGKSLQLFIIKQTPRSPTLTFINPHIEKLLDETPENNLSEKSEDSPDKDHEDNIKLEGCLSLYSIWGKVKRSPSLILSYQDESGKSHKRKFTGFIATIIQHEFDHLQGFLFTKRVIEQKQKLYKSKRNEKGETEFEEIEL